MINSSSDNAQKLKSINRRMFITGSEKFFIMSGLYFNPQITIINSKKIIKLTISPTGI